MESNGSSPEPNEWEEVADSAKTFSRWALAGLIDGVFLIVWALTQWVVGWVLQRLPLDGIDAILLNVFQVLFAIATVAPILFYIYKDIRIMWIRTRRAIRKEQERDRSKQRASR